MCNPIMYKRQRLQKLAEIDEVHSLRPTVLYQHQRTNLQKSPTVMVSIFLYGWSLLLSVL